MPLAGRPLAPPSFLHSLVPLLAAPFHPFGVAVVEIVTLPGQALISLLLVLAAAWRLWTRGRSGAAVCWTAAWFVGIAVEVVFRHELTRPALLRHGVHLVAFDMSWPSGHALRCAIVAGALATAWPRLRIPLVIWLAGAVVLLELAGLHTPTDLVGGLLLATAVAAGAVAVERSGRLRGGAVLRLRRSST
jgi:membrane-associated phospholipid phosphatase